MNTIVTKNDSKIKRQINKKQINQKQINKKQINKKQNINKLIIQKGGTDIITASIDVIKSMIGVGKSIFVEIDSIANMGSELNNASSSGGFPAQSQSPPKQDLPVLS